MTVWVLTCSMCHLQPRVFLCPGALAPTWQSAPPSRLYPTAYHDLILTSAVTITLHRVVMDGFSTSNGVYQLIATCPQTNAPTTVGQTYAPTAAPTPTQPVVVGTLACNTPTTGNTTGGTHNVGMAAPEEWWMFTSPIAGLYTFDTCGSSYDT